MRAPRTRRERLRSDAGFDKCAPHRIERPAIRKLRIADRLDGPIVGQLLGSGRHPHARHCVEVLVDHGAFFPGPFFVRAAVGLARRVVTRHLPPAIRVRQEERPERLRHRSTGCIDHREAIDREPTAHRCRANRHAPAANRLRQLEPGEVDVCRDGGVIEDGRKAVLRVLARLVVLQALVRDVDANTHRAPVLDAIRPCDVDPRHLSPLRHVVGASKVNDHGD